MSDGIELGPSPQASEKSCVGGQHIFRFSRVVGRGLSSVGCGCVASCPNILGMVC